MKIQQFGKPLCRLITMVAICMLSFNAMAYDFSYTYQGKTLYYNITSNNTVEVTPYSLHDYVSNDVIIPSSVSHDGITYSVTSIDSHAFYECRTLTSVTIPNSVTYIGEYAFGSCSSLTSVTIPNSVTYIGSFAFYACCLTSVTIPDGITSIGSGTFYGCYNLASVSIPESVTSIGNGTFYGCCNLTSITIPNGVTYIDNYAFYSCSSLTSIVSKAIVPPSLGNEVFPTPNSYNVAVPCGCLEAYTSSVWNDYFPNRIEEDCSVSLQEVESTMEFDVYPNPTSGKVSLSRVMERVEVIDLAGKVVQTCENASEINIGALPAGVYHLRMSIEEKTITRMLIKE